MHRDEDLLPHVLDVGLRHAEVAQASENVRSVGIEYLTQGGLEIGSQRVKTEPVPTLLSTVMRPPCASTISFTMGRPRPVPPESLALARSVR